jgi:hypothetical protein
MPLARRGGPGVSFAAKNMDRESAKQLILAEALSENSLIVLARMGDEPPKDRIEALLRALKIIFDESREEKMIDRTLAHALFNLGVRLPQEIESWQRQGVKFRESLLSLEIIALLSAIESVLEDVWIKAIK